MSRLVTELICALTDKLDALECLHSILEEEKAGIIGLDTEGLQVNTAKKEQSLEKLTALGERCRTALSDACTEIGISGCDRLSPLAAGLRQPEKGKVLDLQRKLLGAARENARLVELNKGLLEHSLAMIGSSVRFFSKFLTSGGTYGEAGRMLETPASSRLVCKEI